jgi:hypothetical protein
VRRRRGHARPEPEARLDFVIAGAEKAGTTFLVEALRSSPDVAMPAREVRFFRDPFYPERERLEDELAGLDGRLVGIKHPSYLGRPEVPERIAHHYPDVRLLFVLRDPVERAVSAYLHYLRWGQVPFLPPDEGLRRVLDDATASPKYTDVVEFGRYHTYLRRYLDHFDRSQLLVLEYEQVIAGGPDLAPVERFLGIGPLTPPAAPVNEGPADLAACRAAFAASIATYDYDEQLNIVGTRQQPYLHDVRAVLGTLAAANPEPVHVGTETRARLAERYAPEIEALRRSGLLDPQCW